MAGFEIIDTTLRAFVHSKSYVKNHHTLSNTRTIDR